MSWILKGAVPDSTIVILSVFWCGDSYDLGVCASQVFLIAALRSVLCIIMFLSNFRKNVLNLDLK